MSRESLFVGIDVAKDKLDVAVRPTGELWSVANGEEGIGELVSRLLGLSPALVVLEATGGMETALAAVLGCSGLPVAVVNPRQVRDFAKATGRLAKTDRLDAGVIAHFGEALKPTTRPLPDAQAQALKELLARRRQLIAMQTAEKNRLHSTSALVREDILRHIAYLKGELDRIDKELGGRIKASPIYREREKLLRSFKGVGEVTARALLVGLPELGSLERKKLAALVGLAPLNRDSGKLRGKRSIWGGRAQVRSALYMAALSDAHRNPTLRPMYERFLARGKAKKVALTACMRKMLTILNAMLKHNTPWSYRPAV